MTIANFKGLKDSDGEVFKPIPAGRYPARIVDVSIKHTKDSAKYPHKPYFNFKAKIKEGAEGEGKMLFFMAMIPHEEMTETEVENAVNQMKHYAIACGIDVDGDEIDSSDFIGAECCLIVNLKTYEGKESNNVSDVLPIDCYEE